MYTLYIANKNYSSWSLRPWVLMQETGIPFEEIVQSFEEGGSWSKFRGFSPTGLVPCLVDGDTVVWDSLAIVEYLAEQYPSVWPTDKAARAWARSAAAEMHSGFNRLRDVCTMNCGVKVRLSQIDDRLQKDIDRLIELWDQGLNQFGGPFLAGDTFTIVDAFYAPVAFRVATYQLSLSPSAQAYCDRLLGLQSMRDWKAAALKETWREVDHEEELKAAGDIIEDLRG